MGRRITLIQGHPDASPSHLGHALADAYARGAAAAGHAVERIDVAHLEFPLLRTAEEWRSGALPESLREPQAALGRADHLVLIYPLWTGTVPAVLKGFFEQVLRPDFVSPDANAGGAGARGLKGKSARVVVTLGMPAFVYRWVYLAHGVAAINRNVFKFCGVRSVRTTYIGGVGADRFDGEKWLRRMSDLGRRSA
ncbi:MAG: NAD(P)H-dependent oxidoreductase [Verrucomicrobia bacterium]|nr:NAD(P)H-dependent oxidoreductase [Verrucomicrobiota bacterium]